MSWDSSNTFCFATVPCDLVVGILEMGSLFIHSNLLMNRDWWHTQLFSHVLEEKCNGIDCDEREGKGLPFLTTL